MSEVTLESQLFDIIKDKEMPEYVKLAKLDMLVTLGVDELISDEPIKIGDWEPKNYDKKFRGAVSVKEAFAKSLNAATVDLATNTSLEDIIEMAHRLGISSPIKPHPAIILGATDVKVIDMASAYGVVFNDGYEVLPYVIDSIWDTNDNVLYQHYEGEKRKILDDSVVESAKNVLRAVVVWGTGKKANKVKNAHGKTGTSQNYRDAWFVGFNDKYVGAVWVGNDNNKPMNEISGGGVPTEVWGDIF